MERKLRITVEGRQYMVTVEDLTESGSQLYPPAGGVVLPLMPAPAAAAPPAAPLTAAGPGDVVSTLGGVVDKVHVTLGQAVRQGEEIVVVQAMKMNTPMVAPRAGTVTGLAVKAGDAVQAGQVLATIG